MQKSSIVGSVLLGLFGLPFLGFGLLFLVKMSEAAGSEKNPGAFLGMAFGALFACIGLGLIAVAVYSLRYSKRQDAVIAANPGAPWMWREDWAVGRSDGKSPKANIGLWIFAIFWDAISFPAATLTFPKLVEGDLRLLLVMIFPVIGIILTAAAVLGTMRSQRFGRTSFWLASNPFVPGGKVSGFIHLRMPTTASHGIDLRLSCLRQVTTGSGKNRSTVNTVLWQNERNVGGEQLSRTDFDAQVPVEFTIPADVSVTNSDDANDKVVWILHAQADLPGVDFKDDYELPVFQTGSAKSFAAAASGWTDAGAHNRESNLSRPQWETPTSVATVTDEPVAAPLNTRITITEDGASINVYLPPFRNPGQVFGLLAFTVVWTGVVYMLFKFPAPWIFRIVFGGSDILLCLVLLNLMLGSTRVRVGEGILSIRNAIAGLGWIRSVPVEGIQSISPVSHGQTDASGAARFGVYIQLTDSRVFRIAANSLSRSEARWIVAALDRALGRKVEAQPQFKPLSFNLPSDTKVGVVRVGGVSISKIQKWIGFIVFAGGLLFFAAIALRIFLR